jgi:hypothetical protein
MNSLSYQHGIEALQIWKVLQGNYFCFFKKELIIYLHCFIYFEFQHKQNLVDL